MTKEEFGNIEVGDTVEASGWTGRKVTGVIIIKSETGMVVGGEGKRGKLSVGSYSYKRVRLIKKGGGERVIDVVRIEARLQDIDNAVASIRAIL